jgi:hypothetical protein
MDGNVHINENRYGVYINMNELSSDVIDKLSKYIDYLKIQDRIFSEREEQCRNIENYQSSTFENS